LNRGDFQELAEDHLRHAKALLDAELYSGAYYMCGYAIECALKACIARRTNQFDFPDKRFANSVWTHDLAECDALRGKWQTVDYWSEDSRYEPRAQKAAADLFSAVADPDHGMLACLKRFW
jgi:hypothetical protein